MKSRQMALCGLLTALAVVCMVLAGAMGIGTYLGPMLAMAALSRHFKMEHTASAPVMKNSATFPG